MLPLWHNELRVVFCPDKVVLLCLGKGFRRKVIFKKILLCTILPGIPIWRPALDVFEQWLDTSNVSRASVTIILSNSFVRYALTPFSAEVASYSEEQALARIMLENIYGDMAKQWHLTVGLGGYGESRLIAAVDAELLDEMAGIIAPTSLKITSVRPYLVSAFNCFYKQVNAEHGIFVLAELEQIVTIIFKNHQLTAVGRMPFNGNLADQLPNLLSREMLMNGLEMEEIPVYLHAVESPNLELESSDEIPIQILRHLGRDRYWFNDDVRFGMACY